MTFENGRVHFVGIGGAGMSAIAKVLLERGVAVSGSDIKASPTTAGLESLGAAVDIGHAAAHVEGATTVVVSAAITERNPEVIRAGEIGIVVMTRGAALAALLDDSPRSIVVAGTHGKTTTTSMIVSVLTGAGIDPTYLVGGGLNDSGTNARSGAGEWVVAESDESDGSFLLLHPTVAVVTNIELDHVDHWATMDELQGAFTTFLGRVPEDGTAILPAGDDSLALPTRGRVITFGLEGDVHAENVTPSPSGTHFDLLIGGDSSAVQLQVPGSHNVSNALAAAAAAHAVGLEVDTIAAGLGSFAGVQRRFEVKGIHSGVTIIDDYAHHPTEIAATLAAAKENDWHRIIAVFQPHRYSRTAALGERFGASFSDADRVVVTDIYGAGEEPTPGVTGKLIADSVSEQLPGRPLAYIPHRRDLVTYVAATARPGDLVLTMGAGDITTLAVDLMLQLGHEG